MSRKIKITPEMRAEIKQARIECGLTAIQLSEKLRDLFIKNGMKPRSRTWISSIENKQVNTIDEDTYALLMSVMKKDNCNVQEQLQEIYEMRSLSWDKKIIVTDDISQWDNPNAETEDIEELIQMLFEAIRNMDSDVKETRIFPHALKTLIRNIESSPEYATMQMNIPFYELPYIQNSTFEQELLADCRGLHNINKNEFETRVSREKLEEEKRRKELNRKKNSLMAIRYTLEVIYHAILDEQGTGYIATQTQIIEDRFYNQFLSEDKDYKDIHDRIAYFEYTETAEMPELKEDLKTLVQKYNELCNEVELDPIILNADI